MIFPQKKDTLHVEGVFNKSGTKRQTLVVSRSIGKAYWAPH
jgi:hypothetical protein